MMEPFTAVAQAEQDKFVRGKVFENVFLKFLVKYSTLKDSPEVEDEDDEVTPTFENVDVKEVSKLLFQAASGEATIDPNRRQIYDMQKTYEKRIRKRVPEPAQPDNPSKNKAGSKRKTNPPKKRQLEEAAPEPKSPEPETSEAPADEREAEEDAEDEKARKDPRVKLAMIIRSLPNDAAASCADIVTDASLMLWNGVKDWFKDTARETTAKRSDEIVTQVLLPAESDQEHCRSSFWKLRRRGSIDFAVLSVAAAVWLTDNNVVSDFYDDSGNDRARFQALYGEAFFK